MSHKITFETDSPLTAQMLSNLAQLLQSMGDEGASGSITVEWDGDGDDRLKSVQTTIQPSLTDKQLDVIYDGVETIALCEDRLYVKQYEEQGSHEKEVEKDGTLT